MDALDPSTIQLRGNTCLVKVIVPENKTKGGIIIPERSPRKRVKHGILVSTGPDAPVEVHVGASKGHKAHIHGHAIEQAKIRWEGQDYAVFHGEDIMAVEA